MDTRRSIVRYRLYSVLKASVTALGAGTSAVPARKVGTCRPFFEVIELHWAYSSVGLEHTPDKREVGSSNLPRPTTDQGRDLTVSAPLR